MSVAAVSVASRPQVSDEFLKQQERKLEAGKRVKSLRDQIKYLDDRHAKAVARVKQVLREAEAEFIQLYGVQS